jgi:hypothetical protein
MTSENQSAIKEFNYKLTLSDGNVLEFPIRIDLNTETFCPPDNRQELPAWTALNYQRCENCPLSESATPHCPVAVNLMPLIQISAALTSYEAVQLELKTKDRTISGNTTLQRALSSVLGLIMATSPCPHTEYLKPMAHFHLPLANPDETVYRTTTMYLLAQHFRYNDGLDAALDFNGLTEIYQQLQIINRYLTRRFQAAISEDATVNAIILLDLLSQSVTWSIEDGLDQLRPLFKRYGIE